MSHPNRAARVIVTLLALGAAVGAGFAFKPAVYANLSPKNFGIVDPGKVLRSGQLTPAALHSLAKEHGIKTIIDFGSEEFGTPGDRRNQRCADALGIPRYRFDLVGDATGNPNWYVHALRIMTDPARQPVLVHCGAGSERTGCAVILYNALVHGASIEQGHQDARQFKHNPARNPKLGEVLAKHAQPILDAVRTGTPIPGVEPIPTPAPQQAATK